MKKFLPLVLAVSMASAPMMASAAKHSHEPYHNINMVKALDLSTDQRNAIQKIFKEQRQDIRQAIQKIREETDTKILELLTSDQRKEYEALKKKRAKKWEKKHKQHKKGKKRTGEAPALK